MSSNDTGIAVGLKKGFIVTKRAKKVRPSQSKGVRIVAWNYLYIYIRAGLGENCWGRNDDKKERTCCSGLLFPYLWKRGRLVSSRRRDFLI